MVDFLYIHVPFCKRKCSYCDFFSVPYEQRLVKMYVDALNMELLMRGDAGGILKAVYFGGGTPSLLDAQLFSEIFGCLRHNFNISESAEITIEANPGTLQAPAVRAMRSLGVNRVSVGIQSLDNRELKTLGRIHTAEEAIQSVELVQKAGIRNLSIDLMYGIPGQTRESWRETLRRAVDCSPTHISAYELTLEEETNLCRSIRSGTSSMPEEDSVISMYGHLIDYLEGRGFEHYEISNFAAAGHRCVHNLNYWERGEYLGFGPGAHSFSKGIRSMNTRDVGDYISRLNRGTPPASERTELSREETLKEFIFLGLRKMEGIPIARAADLHLNLFEASQELIEEGLLEIRNAHLRPTRKGILLSNPVVLRLLENLGL